MIGHIDKNLDQKLEKYFWDLTKEIPSVVIITSKDRQLTLNSFFHKFMRSENSKSKRNNAILHEIVVNARHVFRNTQKDSRLQFKYSKLFNWESFSGFYNKANASTIKTDMEINTIFGEIEKESHGRGEKIDDPINTNDELLLAFSKFNGKMGIIKNKLAALVEQNIVDEYLIFGNFNDELGYYATNIKHGEYESEEEIILFQYWLANMSEIYNFNLYNFVDHLGKLKHDSFTNVTAVINNQLDNPLAQISLEIRKGKLFKAPHMNRSFIGRSLNDIKTDIQLQTTSDVLNRVNPQTYFLYALTANSMYISVPANATNASMLSALYMSVQQLLSLTNCQFDELMKAIKAYIEIHYHENSLSTIDLHHPLIANNEKLLNSEKVRSRRLFSAGKNLTHASVKDMENILNRNTDIEEFVITTALGMHRPTNVYYSHTIENYGKKQLAATITNISYLISGIFGNSTNNIWHMIYDVLGDINSNKIDKVVRVLSHVNESEK